MVREVSKMVKDKDIKNCDFCKVTGSLEEGDITEIVYKDVEGDCSMYICLDCAERILVKNMTPKAAKRVNWCER